MLFYQLPKEKLIYGPNQVEAMIDQNTTISQQLTLWNQQGSRVIRGKQIVTPIENSFLYVVPLYLRAEGTNFPQLKRVIAVAGDTVVMEPTLDEALTALFGMQPPEGAPAAQTTGAATKVTAGQLDAAQARMQFEDAQKAMQQGDWDKFGKAMEALKHLVGQAGLVISAFSAARSPGWMDCFPPRCRRQRSAMRSSMSARLERLLATLRRPPTKLRHRQVPWRTSPS
jgi:hypothetical protein